MDSVTIKLFLIDGHADGLRTAEISNWSGKAISGPRSKLAELRKRPELVAPGIYFLIGEDIETGSTKIYIGEAENVAKRLSSKKHASRDFWVSVISFVSKDSNLTKSHIKYLEGQIISRAKELGILIDNEQSSGSSLPESDAADMDHFLNKMYQLLPVLGLSIFDVPEKVSLDSEDWLTCSIKGLIAKGRRTSNGFLVMEGSQAVLNHRPSSKNGRVKREELIERGLLKEIDGYLVFTKDIEFGSPSTAGSVVKGGNTNGLKAWKNSKGVCLKDLESSIE